MERPNQQPQTPMSEALWRVGTSPWAFLGLSLSLGLWCLIGAFVPQTSLTELGFQSGGSSVQTARLFHAHAIAESWVTWMLIGLLFCNAIGLLLSRTGRIVQFNVLAIVLGSLAVLGSIIGHESGTIWVKETLNTDTAATNKDGQQIHQGNFFLAETRSGSGKKRVELPFRLKCEPGRISGVGCTVDGIEGGPQPIVIPPAGTGSAKVSGYELSVIGFRPIGKSWNQKEESQDEKWVRLVDKSSSWALLESNKVLELRRGKQSQSVKLGTVRMPDGGNIFLAKGEKLMVGVDTRVATPILSEPPIDAPLQIGHVLSPRWIKMAYQAPSSTALGSALFHGGPFLILLAIIFATLGIAAREPEEEL